jgi:uncharacterized membrane protein YhaH (DUF805 family)
LLEVIFFFFLFFFFFILFLFLIINRGSNKYGRFASGRLFLP